MKPPGLDDTLLDQLLEHLPRLHIAVAGDLFLDRYLDLDASLTEVSLETGLDAYQVVRVRPYPGAAGTVVNNLTALGVGRVSVLSVIGDDGEGYELRRELEAQKVDLRWLRLAPDRRTPTYMKPMLHEADRPPRELNRLDIQNRSPLAASDQEAVLLALDALWSECDGMVVVDQVTTADCGVVKRAFRERLAELARKFPAKPVLADSRGRIAAFRGVCVKPNRQECCRAAGTDDVWRAVQWLAAQADRPVFCTCGPEGMVLGHPDGTVEKVPGYPVPGPVDPVGAGDSASAGIICALAAGFPPRVAAGFGNLVASITVQQIGVTGTATPWQIRSRWREIRSLAASDA
jgi:sugar/nucleoside kinase (ribokinase family)